MSDPEAPTRETSISGREFMRRFRWLVFHTWNIPPIVGLGFILLIGVLTPAQILGILTTPLEPAYILGWLAFALWFLPRQMRPLADWLDARPGSSAETALACVRRFPLLFWATFLIYLVIAPASVIVAAELYTDYVPEAVDWFRIELVALIVSIIVGLPIFFLMFDLFGRALGGLTLTRPIITIRTRVFLIGALVPLLIDTMLVQYYWTRTGYFTMETFWVWLLLEALAVGGSLIFAHSFGQSLAPLQALGAHDGDTQTQTLRAQSTDEIGVLVNQYRALLEELALRNVALDFSNRLLRNIGEADAGSLLSRLVDLCREALGSQRAYLVVRAADGALVAVAESGMPYRADGHWRVAADEPSVAQWCLEQGGTAVVEDMLTDPRMNAALRARLGTRSALLTPVGRPGAWLGVLIASHHDRPRQWNARDITLLEALAREAAFVLETQRLREAREQAERQRAADLEFVRTLMDAAEEGIYGGDLEGRCTFINRAALAMLGYERPEELLGQSLHERIHHTHPDGRPYPRELCRVRLATQAGIGAHSDEEVHWRKDGTSFPVEYWSRPIYRDGVIVGTVVSFVDISARKAAERAEARRTQILRTLASTTELLLRQPSSAQFMSEICRLLVLQGGFRMAWIGMVADDGVRVTPVAEAGFDNGYLSGIDVRCDDSAQAQGPTGSAIREGHTVVNDDTETNARFAPWRERARQQGYRSSLATPLRVNGRIIGALNVYSSEPHAFGADEVVLLEKLGADLGHALEREAADAALRDYQEHLEEMVTERTRRLAEQATVIDQIHDAVVATDLDGVITFWNRGAERLFGYSAAEAIGQPVGMLHFDQAFLLNDIVRPLKENGAHEVEVTMRRKDGSAFDGHLSLSMLYDADGRPRGMMGYSIDITPRKRAERLLQQRSDELAAINQELEAFSYSVSHDLRAPLRAIDGFSQALLEDYGDHLDAAGQEYLQRVRASAQRMARLIDDLLNLSRVTRAPLNHGRVDLSAMAHELAQTLRETAPERTVEFKIDEGLAAEGDAALLRIVLENLLGNAWKYTARTAHAEITFGRKDHDGNQVFFVRDNGAGFEMKYANKLFGAFQRLHHPSEFEGTGIGLATVQRIVHRHGGRVWAEGEPGKGACFYFTLGTPAAGAG